MNTQEIINRLQDIETDTSGKIAIAVAIEAMRRGEIKYCPWCDQDEEDYEVRVGLWAEEYNGKKPYEKPDIEFKYCPMCNRIMNWG